MASSKKKDCREKYKKINIAQIIDTLELGGAENVVVNIANQINEAVFNSYLITTIKSGPRLKQLKNSVRYINLHKKSRYDINSMYKLISYLRDNDIDIVHTHSQYTACYYIIASKIFLWRCYHVHSDHDSTEKNWKNRKRIKKYLMRKIDHFFPVSKMIALWEKKYLNTLDEKQTIVWNGVDISKFIPTDEKEKTYIAQVAGLRMPKSLDVSIDALKVLLKIVDVNKYKIKWKVVGGWGDPPTKEQEDLLRRARENTIRKHFVFCGEVKRVDKFLINAKLGVLTSKNEAMPIALCEYLACGLPVVVSDIPIHREIIEESKAGLLAGVGDANGFAEKIKWLFENPKKAEEMGKRAREYAIRKLSLGRQIEEFESTYCRIIGRS